ncbi:Uncharacterised protein [Legionella pneumophila]|nr:Uncharacterised protein [Legionella pneumophila]
MDLLDKISALEEEASQFGFKWQSADQIMTQIHSECDEINSLACTKNRAVYAGQPTGGSALRRGGDSAARAPGRRAVGWRACPAGQARRAADVGAAAASPARQRRSRSSHSGRAARRLRSLTWPKPLTRAGQRAISSASGNRSARRSRNTSSTAASYSRIKARSVRRSSVWPKGSKAVPRSPLSRANTRNAPITQGPYSRLTSSPLSLRRASSGGAR